MAIGNINLTYRDLIDLIITIIKSRCHNIDTNTNMAASIKSGWSRTVTKSTSFNQPVSCLIGTTSTWSNVYTTADVENDFTSYLATCGIGSEKLTTVISYRGLINFLSCSYNYIANYICLS